MLKVLNSPSIAPPTAHSIIPPRWAMRGAKIRMKEYIRTQLLKTKYAFNYSSPNAFRQENSGLELALVDHEENIGNGNELFGINNHTAEDYRLGFEEDLILLQEGRKPKTSGDCRRNGLNWNLNMNGNSRSEKRKVVHSSANNNTVGNYAIETRRSFGGQYMSSSQKTQSPYHRNEERPQNSVNRRNLNLNLQGDLRNRTLMVNARGSSRSGQHTANARSYINDANQKTANYRGNVQFVSENLQIRMNQYLNLLLNHEEEKYKNEVREMADKQKQGDKIRADSRTDSLHHTPRGNTFVRRMKMARKRKTQSSFNGFAGGNRENQNQQNINQESRNHNASSKSSSAYNGIMTPLTQEIEKSQLMKRAERIGSGGRILITQHNAGNKGKNRRMPQLYIAKRNSADPQKLMND